MADLSAPEVLDGLEEILVGVVRDLLAEGLRREVSDEQAKNVIKKIGLRLLLGPSASLDAMMVGKKEGVVPS